MKREQVYLVSFDTQRNRRYIEWGVFIYAHNQKEAKEYAYRLWHSPANPHYGSSAEKPHMFHLSAVRVPENVRDKDPETFWKESTRYASWGRK